MKFREPEVGRRRADGHEFDPVIEGARFRLTAEVAEQIWWVVSHEATDASGELDLDRATRRFREVATRAAARHGRLRTAAGKVTRLEAETRGRESAADVFRRGVPGRRSLVEKEARRQAWRAQPPAPSPELPHQREVEALVERRAADDTDADAWLPLAAPRPASGPPALRVLHGGAGTSLPADLVAQLDDALGAAAQRARIHTGPDAEALADSHHAHAVTFGEDVYFGARAYQPDTVGGQQLIAHEVTHVAQSLRGEQVRGAAKSKSYNTALNGGGLLEGEAELSAAVELDKVTGGYLKGQLKAVVGAGGTKLSGEATFAKGPLRGIVDKFTVTYDVKTKELTAQVVLTVDKLSRLLPKGISASGTVTLDATKNPAGVAFSTASAVDVKIDSLLGGALQDLHIGDGFGATFCPEGDFEIGALKVTFAEGSRLTVDSKTGITGALKGAVQIGALPKIELDVGAGPKGITVHAATTISLADINRQLAGEVRIAYKGGPADRKLSFIADHPRLKDIPGADILAKLEGQSDGNEITGALSARKGARFEHEGVHAIVEKGELALLTGHKLEGDLEGTIHGSVGSGHVTMGLHDGAFSWGAKGKIDLAALTNHVLIGEVEGEAGTNADATFQSKGITFGPKALRGIKITSLSGNLTKRTFKLNVDVTSLADSIAHQIPGVDVKIDHAAAELVYAGGIKIETAIQGHAALRARNNKELASGHFGLTLHEQEFGGLVHIDKFEVSEYLKGNNLFVDLRAGVKTGTVMFDMPGLAHGTADGLVFDVKNRHYGFDAQIDFDGKQQLITGTKLHVKLADGVLSGDVTFANEYVRGAAQLTTGHGGTTFHGHLDKKLGGLGKLGDAFTGAELSYSKVTGLVAKGGFNLGGLSTMLGAGSKVELSYANHKLAVDGTLHAGHLEHVTWGAKNELKMHWEQGGRLKVAGQLDATVANLAEVSLKIAANAGGAGAEGSGEAELDASAPRFFLSGRITGKGLGKFFPGVHFSDPTASVHVENGADGKWSYKVDELAGGRLIGIDGIDEADATFTGNYVTGKGLTASAKLNKLRIKQFTATGAISIKDNHLEQTELGMEAAFPGVKLKGNVQVAKGELGHLSWKAHVEAVPSEGGPLSWVKSGSLDATMEKGKLTEAKGSLALKPPSFLPVENPHIDLKYDGEHIVGTLDAEFASPLHKTKKGTLKVTIGGPKKFEAEIHMPAKLPGMKEAEVYGKVTADGHVEIGAVLEPDGLPFIKKARVSITFANGAFVIGGFLTIAPTDDYEVELGVEYDITNKQFHVKGLEPKHDDKAKDTPLLSLNHDKHLPNVPLFGIGVLNVVLTMRASVGININKPFIKFETPKLIGGLEALDEGRMPGIEFGGKVGIGAELFAEFGIGIAGQVQLLIASAEMGIEGVLHAGLTMNLQSDIHGKFEHGKGVELTIDPSVSAALKLTASLNAFLHAEALWWTIIDKHWPLASMDLADIPLGEFHPFDPFKLTLGGTGGTTIETPKIKDPTAMTDGASKSAQAASDEASNAETKAKVKPVLARIREVAKRFEQKPDWKGKGLTIPYVEFDSWYGIDQDKWDTYREVADNAEQMVPEEACKTPTERLSKAVAILSKRNPVVAGMVVLAYERAQVAADGYNPDTGEDVVAKQKEIEALVMIQYAEAMAAWQEQVAAQAASHEQAKTKQTTDFAAAEAQHTARTHETQQAFERQTQQATDALQAQQAKLGSAQAGGGSAPAPAAAPPIAKPVAPVATKLQKPEPIAAPAPIAQPAPPAPVPAITLPAIPQDPGVSPPSAAMVPKAKPAKVVQPPPAKGTPVPAAPSSQAAALGGKSATSKGGGGGGGAKAAPQTPLQPAAGGGGGSTAPGPVVAEGPPGIIAQDKSLEQRRAALGGKGGAPAAAAPVAPVAAAPAASGAAAPAPGKAEPAKAPVSEPDASVQKVVAAGKADEDKQKTEATSRANAYQAQTEVEKQAAIAAEAKLKAAQPAVAPAGPVSADGAAPEGATPDAKAPDATGPDRLSPLQRAWLEENSSTAQARITPLLAQIPGLVAAIAAKVATGAADGETKGDARRVPALKEELEKAQTASAELSALLRDATFDQAKNHLVSKVLAPVFKVEKELPTIAARHKVEHGAKASDAKPADAMASSDPTAPDTKGADAKAPDHKLSIPFTMHGAAHHLIITQSASPRVEMASTIGLLTAKIDALVAALSSVTPPPTAQLAALARLKTAANALEHALQATNGATPPTQLGNNSPEAQAVVHALVAYASTYDADDLDVLADPAAALRAHAGYGWLRTHGLAVDFETRILTQATRFPRPRVRAILDGIAKWSAVPGFAFKVTQAVDTNRFWSPNDGFFFELEALGSLNDLRIADVTIGGNVIDALTAAGVLIDTKFEIGMDPASLLPGQTPQLKPAIRRQMAAMVGAVGTVIGGITIKDWHFLCASAPDATTQAYLNAQGIASHFVTR